MYPCDWPDYSLLVSYQVITQSSGNVPRRIALLQNTTQEQFFEHLVEDVLGIGTPHISSVLMLSAESYDLLLPQFLINGFLVMNEGEVQ